MKMLQKSKEDTGNNKTLSNTISRKTNNTATVENNEGVTISREQQMDKEQKYVVHDYQKNNHATDTTLENKSFNKENKVCTEIKNGSKEIEVNAKAETSDNKNENERANLVAFERLLSNTNININKVTSSVNAQEICSSKVNINNTNQNELNSAIDENNKKETMMVNNSKHVYGIDNYTLITTNTYGFNYSKKNEDTKTTNEFTITQISKTTSNVKEKYQNNDERKEFDDILAELRGRHTDNGSDDISLEDIDVILNNTQDDTYNFQEIKYTNLSTLNNSCVDSLLDRNVAKFEDGSDIISLSSEEFDNSDKVVIAKQTNIEQNVTKMGKHSINNTNAKMRNALTNKNFIDLREVNDIIDLTQDIPSNLKETTIKHGNINTNKRGKLTTYATQYQCPAINSILTIDQQLSHNKDPNREERLPIEKDITQNASKENTDQQSKEKNYSYKIQNVQTINKDIAKNVENTNKEYDKTVHFKHIQDVRTTDIELGDRNTVRPMEVAQNIDTNIEYNNEQFKESNHTNDTQNVATIKNEFAQNINLVSAEATAQNASKESGINIHSHNITDEAIIEIEFNQVINTSCPMVTTQNGDEKTEHVNGVVNENYSQKIQNDTFKIDTVQNRNILVPQNVNPDVRTIEIQILPNASTYSKEIVKNEDAIINNLSDDDCGYQSSDFEFITEEEARMDGFIINFDPETYINDFRDHDSDIFNMSSIESNSNSRNSDMQFDPYGPGPSRNIKIVRNATQNNSDFVGRDFVNPRVFVNPNFNPRNPEFQFDPFGPGPSRTVAVVENDEEDDRIPDEQQFINMFQNYNLGISLQEIHILENKSLMTRAATLAPYKNVGFDVNLLAVHADSSEDEYREEAEENLKKIFQNYPAENNRRKRRRR